MKIKYALLGILFAVIAYGAWFVYTNLRGSGAAFGPIPRISEEAVNTAPLSTASINRTGLPLTVADGVSLSIFAKDLGAPRVLTEDATGTILTSIPAQSKVVALPDANADGVADSVMTVAEGLSLPHGIAFHGGRLFIAETNMVASYAYDPTTKKATDKKKLFDLPVGGNHFSRSIGFGPDGKLYVSIGSSCNVCVEKDPRRAAIFVANADGSGFRSFATGLRNTVFFTWHPETREMWGTDMGRDLLGDNTPFEEVNIIKDGAYYGWPYCYNNKTHDGSFDPSAQAKEKCEASVSPHITFQAHAAPLGLAFVPESWPPQYRGDLLVAYHGSWNRSAPTGYKIARFDLNEQHAANEESDFIAGWLVGNGALGRPVGLLFSHDDTLYISDDKSGTIYRAVPVAPSGK